MAMIRTAIELAPTEITELVNLLSGMDASVAKEVASAFSGLASGHIASLEIRSVGSPPFSDDSVIDIGELHIDVRAHAVAVSGVSVQLTPKEFDILELLARNRGVLFSKEQIYRAVWKDDYLLDDSNIMAFVRKLRKKIEPEPDNPRYILTVWGAGYKMTDKAD